MKSPLPTNRLVSLTLAGAVLTGVVALALAAPGLGLGVDSLTDENPTVASDAPTPNEDFTPAVGTQGDDEHENDEYEEHEEYEDEYEEEDDD